MLKQTRNPKLNEIERRLKEDMDIFFGKGGKIEKCPSYRETLKIPADEIEAMRKRAKKPGTVNTI